MVQQTLDIENQNGDLTSNYNAVDLEIKQLTKKINMLFEDIVKINEKMVRFYKLKLTHVNCDGSEIIEYQCSNCGAKLVEEK